VAGNSGPIIPGNIGIQPCFGNLWKEASFVREAYPLKDFTPYRTLPSFVLGIANVRGQVLSVIEY